MRKENVRRIKALTLCAVMAFGLLVGAPAGKVQAGTSGISISMVDESSYNSETYEYEKTYSIYYEDGEGLTAPQGVSYDNATRTMTLENCAGENLRLNVYMYEGDFNLNVKGDNALDSIEISTDQEDMGKKSFNFNITGDGSLKINEKKRSDSGIQIWEWQKSAIHVDQYVNLTVYAKDQEEGESGHFSHFASGAIVNLVTTVQTKEEAIAIDGDVEGGLKLEENGKTIRGVTPEIYYVYDESGFLCRNKEYGSYYVAEYGNYGASASGKGYYMIPITNLTSNHCFSWGGADEVITDYSKITEKYDILSSIPEELAGKGYLSAADGKVNITVYGRGQGSTKTGECKDANGNLYAFVQDYTTTDTNEDGKISQDEYTYFYKLYSMKAVGGAFYDGETNGLYYTSKDAYDKAMENDIIIEDTGEQDPDFWSATDSYFDDLEAAGYEVVIDNIYHTYRVDNNPLVVKAKAKPAAKITAAADSYTKTYGDAAFSLGATTDEGASLTYVSDNDKVATVSATGEVAIVGCGTAKITITASGEYYQNAVKEVTVTVNHKESGWQSDADGHWKICEGCKQVIVEKAPHVKDAGTVTKAATEAEAGVMTYTCTECGYSWTEEIAKLAPATTEAPKTETPTTETPVAVTVGTTTTDDSGATYTVTESESGKTEVEYTAADTTAKKVSIPSTVTLADGTTATVTSIADNAFSGNKTITAVTIPATVEEIGDNAFKNCTKLKNVTIPQNVEEVGKNAFAGCTSLTKVTVKGNSLTKVDQGAFKNCKKLKNVTLPKSVTSIGKDAFSGDKKLKTITIKSTKLKTIGKNAFKNVPSSTTIKVPAKQKKAYTKLLKKAGFKGKIK